MVRALLVAVSALVLATALAPLAGAVASVHVDTDGLPELPSLAPVLDVRVEATLGADGASDDHAGGDATGSRMPSEDAGAMDEGEPLQKGVTTVPPAAATLGGPALWLAVQGALRLLEGGAFAGYARITRADVLENKVRERVYALLRERPGLSPTEVQERLGLGWGTTVYHLDRLERTGLVKSEKSGLSRRFYPAADVTPTERKARATLARPQLSTLATHVLHNPGLLQRELAERAGLTPGAVTKQLAALEAAGLVARERHGRTARVIPTPELAALADAPTPPHAAPGEGLSLATS